MRVNKLIEERTLRPRGEAFKPENEVRERVLEDRTIVNVHALAKEYKLAQAYASVRNLEFRAERSVELETFRDYLERIGGFRPVNFVEQPRPDYPQDERYLDTRSALHHPRGEVMVLVDDDVHDAVADSLRRYVTDIGREGYWGTIHLVRGGTPADVRAYIHKRNPAGALLVGAVPAAWFEMSDDFHGAASFPCDLYYMDRQGGWGDPDSDGLFSSHTGHVAPEIWVGRLWTPTAGGNDAAVINDYFERNHRFRLGRLGHARSALAYVDDDWQGFDDCAFDHLFPASEITKYTNPTVTDVDLYKAEVNTLRAWVQLCAHSSVHSHALRVGATNEHVGSPYFRDTNSPNAHFYNLFCCGPGRFTSPDYLAGWYIFDRSTRGTNHGLAAVASAKSGSMKYFEDFYGPMGQGKVIGDAYVDWWKDRGPSHDLGERRWFYGLALLGDPTLSWWKGAVPGLEQPEEEDVFDHWPRRMQLRWDPVALPGVKYTVEVDAYGAVNSGQWAAETGQSFRTYHNITGNTLEHVFVGAQRGRWRVRAKVDGTFCAWSPWSYFRFTV